MRRRTRLWKKYPRLKHFSTNKERQLLLFFGVLGSILLIKLFWIQVIQADHYEALISAQQIQSTRLEAERGDIYISNSAGKYIALTENINVYTVYADPEFITQKAKVVDILSTLVYYHFCRQYGLQEPTKRECIQHIEDFSDQKILPDEPQVFYYTSGLVSKNYYEFDFTGYNQRLLSGLNSFTPAKAKEIIRQTLDQKIVRGNRERNYLGFFENPEFLSILSGGQFPYIDILNEHYVYVNYPRVRTQKKHAQQQLTDLFSRFGYEADIPQITKALRQQRYRYVKIIDGANPLIAKKINELKDQYYDDRDKNNIPLLHGIGIKKEVKRYYPFQTFMANIIGYISNDGKAFHGIEQYFDDILAGKDGEIKGRSSMWIGAVGAGDFDIKQAEHGADVYLTINFGIQKAIERIAKEFHERLYADSISILVYDPYSGHIVASVNYPTFNPNTYPKAFFLQPLSPEYRRFIDDETYVDVPIYVYTGEQLKLANTKERFNTVAPKYLPENIYGPNVFVDKNISYPYDPGSIFKALTYAIGLDTNEISRYEYYEDPKGYVKIDQYTIENASDVCQGTHNFLFALEHSCNVGIVRIVQKLTKYVFYNYVHKLGFGKLTNIQLANEDPGYVRPVSTVSTARFLNNSFGLGILVTPLQMAVAYGSLVNHGELLQPTIVKKICYHKDTRVCFPVQKKVVRQVFGKDITEKLLPSLQKVVEAEENAEHVALSGYKLGGKSGTAALVYKGRYMEGEGWTNASYIGIVTAQHPKYVVTIQVRRPRSSQWGTETAGKVFKKIAEFLIGYENMSMEE